MADIEQPRRHTNEETRFQEKATDASENTKNTGICEIGEAIDEPFLITFGLDDPENPKNLSKMAKWGVTGAVSVTAFNRILVSTIMAPAITTIANELDMSDIESVMALSIYLLATAFGPLIIGPLSEIYGRKPIIHITNVWFLVWNLIGGFANSKGLLIASRLLAGFGASAVYAVGYGVLADVWSAEQRWTSLGLYLLVPLLGAAVGPIVGGYITEYTTWRWMFWSTSILQAVLALSSIPVVLETYAPLILRRRAVDMRKDTGDQRYYSEIEVREEGRSALWKLQNSLSRPFRLLLFHPIVQIQAILGAVDYGLLYFALTTFSGLFVSAYGESMSTSGLHYIALCLGQVVGAQLCGPLMDYIYSKLTARACGHASPELRIPLMVPGAFFTPIGLLIYGWAAQFHVFWLVVDIGAAILSLGMQIFGIALQAYVMDCYPEHVSSASAAAQFLRSLTAFAFPLFAPKMYETLGFGWGNTLLAFLSVGITVPSTGLLWRFGARIRAKARSSH